MHLEKVGNKYLKIDGVQIKMKEPYKYAEAYIEEGFYQTAKILFDRDLLEEKEEYAKGK